MGRVELRVREIRTETDGWRAVLDGPGVPEPHSSLASDDSACPPLPCSSIAWTNIRAAAEVFAGAVTGLEEEQAGPEVLDDLRTALVHTSHAVTVLAPPRRERTTFAMRIAWTALDGRAADPGIAVLTPFPSPIAAREVGGLLRDRNFRASPRWSDRSSVRVAGDHMAGRVVDPALFEDTMRFLWAADTTSAPLRDDLVTSAESVYVLLDRAVTLWRARRLALPTEPGAVDAGSVFVTAETQRDGTRS